MEAALIGLKRVDGAGPVVRLHSNDQARDMIVAVRQKIDGYRDSKRAGLLHVRSELVSTIALASTLTYLLLWTAIAALWQAGSTPLSAVQQGAMGGAICL